MAARKNPRRPLGKMHDEKTRQKIQTTQIVNRLTSHVLAEEDIMSSSQVRAAEILLRKTLPDMTAISGMDGEGNLVPVSFNLNFGD